MSDGERLRHRLSRHHDDDPIRATERWFLANGLSYFVPAEREAARAALRPRRALPVAVGGLLLAAALGGLLGWASDEVSAAPALWLSVSLLLGLSYLSGSVRARPILTFAAARTVTSVRILASTLTRAIPLLLVFLTFLFINAEAWQMTASLTFATHWVVALLLVGTGVVFLLVRLPEEVDRLDAEVDDAFLVRACAGTPMERTCAELVDAPDVDPASYSRVTGFERWNLIIALLVIQLVQVAFLVVGVFAFLVLFGSIIMREPTQLAWTTLEQTSHVPFLESVSIELVKVSLFLAAFSGLYFTVNAVTDETYRSQFFSLVTRELERAVGVRAVYLAARAEAGRAATSEGDGHPS